MDEFTRRAALGVSGGALVFAVSPLRSSMLAARSPADALLDTLAEEYLARSPESATSLGIDTGKRSPLRAKLSEDSLAGRARTAVWLRSALSRIDAVNGGRMDADTRANLEIARTVYQTALEGHGFAYGDATIGGWRNGPYVVAQNMGSHLDVPRFLDSSHKVEKAADAEAYLARLSAHARQLDGETEQLRAARARGVVAPDVVLDKTLAAIRRTRSGSPAEWLVVTSLAKRTEKIPGNWSARALRIAANEIAPALDRQIAELEQHRRQATSDFGVWKFTDGDAYYAWALRAATTTRRTPDEVHLQGQEELKRLQAEIDSGLKNLGFTEGSLAERQRAIAKDPRYAFSEGDKGREEIMAFIDGRIKDIRPRLPRAFNTLMRGNVEVRRIPPAEELGAPGAYGGAGSIDGSIPGRFWINLRSPDMHDRTSLPTLTYHEAIPGHVWQGEYTHKLPLIRTLMGFSAFSEGWGLYAEQLGDELGVYENDPAGRIGYLASMAFRAARMVVDTGVHSKRWPRDKAIAWFAEATGNTPEGVANEIDRYSVWPGQACGYKIGHTEINRQRERARAALGQRFDFGAFNDLVVGRGGRPLTVLERDVDAHIAARSRT
jgi:uncharacterized protein (DUF885 family)